MPFELLARVNELVIVNMHCVGYRISKMYLIPVKINEKCEEITMATIKSTRQGKVQTFDSWQLHIKRMMWRHIPGQIAPDSDPKAAAVCEIEIIKFALI